MQDLAVCPVLFGLIDLTWFKDIVNGGLLIVAVE